MIRRAVKSDAQGILRLLKQIASYHAELYPTMLRADGSKYSVEDIENMLDDSIIFVIEDDGELVGEAICKTRLIYSTPLNYGMKVLFIDDFCIDEERRKEGLGQQLMEKIKEYALEQNYNQIQLSCWQNNISAHSFYEKEGFSDLKRTMYLELK